MLRISNSLAIPLNEIAFSAIRAPGPGGQNVNKVATAIHLRFDIKASSLPEAYKQRLLRLKDRRITKEGVVIIKAMGARTQNQNRQAALERLQALIKRVTQKPKKRLRTRPTRASQQKRLDRKTKHGRLKSLRGKINI